MTTLDADKLAEIKECEQAATPSMVYSELYDIEAVYAKRGDKLTLLLVGSARNENRRNDAIFAANARQYVPALVAEVERLQAENANLQAELENETKWAAHYLALSERLQESSS